MTSDSQKPPAGKPFFYVQRSEPAPPDAERNKTAPVEEALALPETKPAYYVPTEREVQGMQEFAAVVERAEKKNRAYPVTFLALDVTPGDQFMAAGIPGNSVVGVSSDVVKRGVHNTAFGGFAVDHEIGHIENNDILTSNTLIKASRLTNHLAEVSRALQDGRRLETCENINMHFGSAVNFEKLIADTVNHPSFTHTIFKIENASDILKYKSAESLADYFSKNPESFRNFTGGRHFIYTTQLDALRSPLENVVPEPHVSITENQDTRPSVLEEMAREKMRRGLRRVRGAAHRWMDKLAMPQEEREALQRVQDMLQPFEQKGEGIARFTRRFLMASEYIADEYAIRKSENPRRTAAIIEGKTLEGGSWSDEFHVRTDYHPLGSRRAARMRDVAVEVDPLPPLPQGGNKSGSRGR